MEALVVSLEDSVVRMTDLSHRVEKRLETPSLLPVFGLLLLSAAISASVVCGRVEWAIGAVIAAAALATGLHNWRWSVYGLLAYMPFSGIPILLGLPNATLAALLKDLLFVLPAYMGFVLQRRRRGISFPGSKVYLL